MRAADRRREETMRPADAQRTCLYHIPDESNRVCGAKLFGRGRSKWCPSHAEVVREVQKGLNNPSYQRAWRNRHLALYRTLRRIYRTVDKIERHLLKQYTSVQRKRLHWALLTSYRELLDVTSRNCRNYLYRSAILPEGDRAIVVLDHKDAVSL